jgi:tetratricopeptide (TPR) repeat protein
MPSTDPALREAIATVTDRASDDAAWDRLEQVADALQTPDEVMDAYRAALGRGLAREVATRLAERAVRFCQAWYIDTPDAMPALLGLIVERYPDLDWAFERLVVLLTRSAKWSELLTLHDRALAVTRDETKRRALLTDAARLAKDFADEPDRAADYLAQLLRLEPDNDKVVVALERLLERRSRYTELIDLWRGRLAVLSTEEVRAARARIAQISLERLAAPEQALLELRDLIDESPGHPEACQLLERVLALDTAPVVVRREAMMLLRKTYEVVERPAEVVRVLEVGIGFAADDDARALRRELGTRLAILERPAEAMAHYTALLRDAPGDSDARRQLRAIARHHDRTADLIVALTAAGEASDDRAERSSLWLEAADLLATAGRDDDAVDLCRRILAEGEVTESYARRAAHQLSDLLARGQREAERLPIVERLAELERSPSLQRQLLGEAARLAERLNEDERALRNWRKILELDGGDHEALDATIALLDRGGHHRELIAALAQRAGAAVSMEQRRADRVRIAGIEETQLGEPAQAIDSWYAIARDFGYASDVVAALDRLLSATERWPELGEVLEGAVRRERSEAAHHLVRCAKVLATQLGRTDTASELYRQALELDPTDDAASAGLVALLDDPNLGEDAGEALWRAFDRRGQWQRMIDLVEPRLATMGEDRKRAALLADAARLSEQGNDSKAALGFVRRAIAFDPRRRDLRAELLRLAEAENRWVEAAACLREAALAFGEDRGSAAELRREEGRIAEQNLRDYALACDAYRAANELMPSDASSGKGAVRCAARAGRWADAAELIVSVTLLLGQVDDEVLADVELAASLADDAWLLACDALSTTLENGVELDSRLAGRLWGRIAEWHRDQTGDIERAKSAASRSVAAQPDDVETLQRLATLQRSSPSPELADTLLRLDALVGEDSLDALREAAEITSNEDSGVAVLQRLFRKSSELVSSDRPATGIHTASESAAWAMQRLVDRLVSEDRGAQAARLLLRSGEIGLDAEARARAHLRAAELLIAGGDRSLAIDALRRVLADAPDDRTAIARLAELIELEEESSGTIALRHRQVEMTEDREARLALRLTFADRTAKTEEKGACIDWLLQNLAEAPGHGATIDALCRVLDRRSQHKRLAEILEQQADIVRASGQRDQAASLWSRVADVAERNLADAARATAAHERAVAEVPSPRAFDALARLCSMQDQHGDAAKWLQRRLETATAAERTTVMHKLARTQLRAGRESDAIATLRAAFQESPHNAELRKLLLPLLRQREDWGALATTLAASLEHAGDEATVLSYAREAADVYYHKLGAITDAVPVLRRAVALAPEDKRLRAMLADGLRAVGELDEARALLGQLIEDFGRRGSPERAAAHTLMARVLSARGQVSEAMAQLDVASAMAPDDVVILRTLAELAREAGQLERAEAALRTLLLMARRFAAESASAAPIGSAEVLFELSSLAAARGQGEQAAELAESAIEALGESDARLPQLMSGLRERGELALLLRLHDARLGKVLSPFRKGQILGEKAELLERLDRQAEGFDAAMEAIAADPGSPPLHDVARQLATKVGATERYATGLRELLGRTRRDTDGLARCELWLRLGEIESERGAQEAAGRCYDEAAATGVREVDVLRARARAASARGDEREHIRLLQQLANLGEDQVETRADALYRIAEVQLADEASLEEGIEALDKALADTRRPERACMILRRAVERHPSEPRLLAVY